VFECIFVFSNIVYCEVTLIIRE